MSLEKMIKIAKGQADEKAAIRIKLPAYLKKQLVEMTTKNEITINAFLIALIDDVLNGDLRDKNNLEAIEKMEKLIKSREEIKNAIEGNGQFVTTSDGQEVDLYEKLEDNKYMIKLLQGII